MKSYTAFVEFESEGCVEEVDVVAASLAEAKAKVKAVLAADYQPGGKVLRVVPSLEAGGAWVQ
ncbi:MAG: hypothetical protein EBT68_07415 [Verrucomicrobia bacterium]|nr:hypothetical protein [Verrucomicrobiota bacterium]